MYLYNDNIMIISIICSWSWTQWNEINVHRCFLKSKLVLRYLSSLCSPAEFLFTVRVNLLLRLKSLPYRALERFITINRNNYNFCTDLVNFTAEIKSFCSLKVLPIYDARRFPLQLKFVLSLIFIFLCFSGYIVTNWYSFSCNFTWLSS